MQKFNRKPITIILIAITVLVLTAAAFSLVKSRRPADNKAAVAKPALTVSTTLPESVSLPVKLSANGNITAWQEAIIGSESNGLRLVQVRANVGDRVKAGQELAVFSGDSVKADMAQSRASLIEAQATAADAADNAARAKTLESSGALSAQQINQYNTSAQTAKARVEAAQAMLDAQQLRGRQTRVLAPDDGVISARTATVGSVVGTGTELFRMIRGGRLEWRAEVTSAELGRIQPGTAVTIVAASGAALTGKVRMIAPSVDPQTRNALVYVDLPVSAGMASPGKVGSARPPQAGTAPSGSSAVREAPGEGTKSGAKSGASEGVALAGMFARGEFDLGTTTAMTVPQSALVVRDGFNYVFRLNPDNRITQVKVQTGRLVGERLEIMSGLPADARVIASGAGFLNDGDLVRVNDNAALNVPEAPALTAVSASK